MLSKNDNIIRRRLISTLKYIHNNLVNSQTICMFNRLLIKYLSQ